MYFKVTASGGFFELTVLLEVFARPGLSSPDTAGTWNPQGKVSSFTHPSSWAAGKRPACTGPQEHCRAQSEPEPVESTGKLGTVRDGHQLGQHKAHKGTEGSGSWRDSATIFSMP